MIVYSGFWDYFGHELAGPIVAAVLGGVMLAARFALRLFPGRSAITKRVPSR